MQQSLLSVRPAVIDDIPALMDLHSGAWRHAYRGIIPGRDLERMLQHRGPRWWRAAIQRGGGFLVADFDDQLAGYSSFGRSRDLSARYCGEIYELYVLPEFQGAGIGGRLFRGARVDLTQRGFPALVVWALEANSLATAFYETRGGRAAERRDERFGDRICVRRAFRFEPLQPR